MKKIGEAIQIVLFTSTQTGNRWSTNKLKTVHLNF